MGAYGVTLSTLGKIESSPVILDAALPFCDIFFGL